MSRNIFLRFFFFFYKPGNNAKIISTYNILLIKKIKKNIYIFYNNNLYILIYLRRILYKILKYKINKILIWKSIKPSYKK